MLVKYKNNTADTQIIEYIANEIRKHAEEWYGDKAVLLDSTPSIQTFDSSFFLRFSIANHSEEPHYLLVKVRRHPKMTSLAETMSTPKIHVNMPGEFRALKTVSDFSPYFDKGLGAVRPLLYLNELNAIILEECPSLTMTKILTSCAKSSIQMKKNIRRMIDAATKTGQWLSIYHEKIHTCKVIDYSNAIILSQIHQLLERLEIASQKKVNKNQLCKEFEEALSKTSVNKIEYTTNHGDMTCDNILYSTDHKAYSIDIKAKEAPIYADLGILLVHPETFKFQLLSFGIILRESLLKKYRRAIIQGYFGNRSPNYFLIYFYSAINILDKWVMYQEILYGYKGIKRLASFAGTILLITYFKRKIRKYLNRAVQSNIKFMDLQLSCSEG